MKIGVTGATGFIGRNLVRYLSEEIGCDVVALARNPADLGDSSQKFKVKCGDVRDISSLTSAFDGCDVIVHLAGLFNHPELTKQDYIDVNVKGTENVLKCAQTLGVARVVHCSTVGVASGGTMPYGEDAPYSPPVWDKYETTKADGEQLAIEFGQKNNYPVFIVRPAQVYGPGDLSKLKFYKMVKKGVIVSPGKTKKHLIYIEDLSRAFYLACIAEDGALEPIIIANNLPTPLTELTQMVANALDVDYPKIRLPQLPVTMAATVIEVVFNAINKKPPVFRRSMNFFNKSVEFDNRNAMKYLEFKAEIPVEDGVKRAAEWYRNNGKI